MTKFTIDITDKAMLAGIADAKAAFNASLPVLTDEKGVAQPVEDHPDYSASDDAYFQARMSDVARSYGRQFGYDPEVLQTKQAEVADIQAKMAAKGI